MIPLGATGTAAGLTEKLILRVTRNPTEIVQRTNAVLLTDTVPSVAELSGFAAVLCRQPLPNALPVPSISGLSVDHLNSGDVVSLDVTGYVRTLYRRNSDHNALFATDHCNSYCLMCSQPPKKVDETGRVSELLRLISLIPPTTPFLGMTGGEPTLLKDGFLEVIRACKDQLPQTSLHVLTNGRMFYYGSFARRLAEVQHPELMLGIPVYSDLDHEHDYVVQAKGALDQTLVGLQNLGRFGVPIEIRIVVHRLTWERLPELAQFIYRNLTFAAHVAFMGLEHVGFTIPNMNVLWIDPADYRDRLRDAVLMLADRGMTVSIYNHQLCTIDRDVWRFARKSISDWKNEYLSVCELCTVKEQCGGFFTSSVQRNRVSRQIRAFA
jgi:His-Xaa-Ser system radical SAM maturase HxsC